MSRDSRHAEQPRPRRHDRSRHGVAPLQLTSMLDVVFLLLIFFVLTASFAVTEGILPAEMPFGPPRDETATPDLPLIIRLHSAGGADVFIELPGKAQPPADYNELAWQLKSLQSGSGGSHAVFDRDDPVVIHPDETVRWEHVVNALNAARRAGYTRVSFAEPKR